MPALVDPQLETVDELLVDVNRSAEEQARLVGEHLQAARNNVLGSMPQEFAVNVDLARRAAGLLKDRNLREKIVSRFKDRRLRSTPG